MPCTEPARERDEGPSPAFAPPTPLELRLVDATNTILELRPRCRCSGTTHGSCRSDSTHGHEDRASAPSGETESRSVVLVAAEDGEPSLAQTIGQMSFRRERGVPVGERVVVPIKLRPEPDTMVPHVTRRPIASPVLGVALLRSHRALSDVHRGLVGSNPLADRLVELDDVHVVGGSGPGVPRWVLRTALLLRHRAPLFPSFGCVSARTSGP